MRLNSRLGKDYDEEEIKAIFQKKYETMRKVNMPFHEAVKIHFEENGITSSNFSDRTDLDRQFYYNFISEDYVPNMNTFVTMCMGLGLDISEANALLEKIRYRFDYRNKVHCAYMFLLTNYQGLCVDDCNKILRALGITDERKELLGSKNYRK